MQEIFLSRQDDKISLCKRKAPLNEVNNKKVENYRTIKKQFFLFSNIQALVP